MFDNLDFTQLTYLQVIGTFLFFAAIDTVASTGIAIVNGNFDPTHLLDFLRTHVLKVGGPILSLATIGHGIPALGIPAIVPAAIAATAALALYAGTVIASVYASWQDKGAVPPATPVKVVQ